MKLKRYIALLLLAVYFMAAGGPALVSLSCRCVAMHLHAEHACCQHCDHSEDALAAKADVSAPCCGNHHSTEVNLYTGSGADNDRIVRCAVVDLPAALAAEYPLDMRIVTTADKVAERRAPFVCRGFVRSTGLRAPPVLV